MTAETSAQVAIQKIRAVMARYRAPMGIPKHDALAEIGQILIDQTEVESISVTPVAPAIGEEA